MKPAKLTCPHAKYDMQMYIQCTKTGEACAHQRWCIGKGWCVLTDGADTCVTRKEGKHDERKAETVKKRRNKV